MSGGEVTVPAQASENAVNNSDFSSLDSFGIELAKTRRDAIDGRRQQGIEDEWVEDDEHYQGIDDANRHEHKAFNQSLKPTNAGSWSTDDKLDKRSTKATGFINITRPYVDAASARISDMLLQGDDQCWGIEPTPIPELEDIAKGELNAHYEGGQQDPELVTLNDGTMVPKGMLARAILEEADARAGAAEKRIEDWLQEGKWYPKMRQVIGDAARIGTGIIKGPIPNSKRRVKWRYDNESRSGVRDITKEIQPESRWVDPYNFFPDPACGEDIQDGNFTWERDYLTKKRVNALLGQPGYVNEQIDNCLLEGPISAENDWNPNETIRDVAARENQLYEIWYYNGLVDVKDLKNTGLNLVDRIPDSVKVVSAVVTMINHRVVKAILDPIDDGTFPYDLITWQKRSGMPWGIGVARQVRTPQRELNAANRNMMDNAALSAGPQIVIDSSVIRPLNNNWEITPRKLWVAREDASIQDVEKAFTIVNIETRQTELMNIIDFSLRMAEEATGLPMILQGQMGEKAPDTLGQTQILNNNGTSVLRRLAKVFDDRVTVPHINRYYHWLMEYGNDEKEKGDFGIIAKGSSTLVERDIQNQELAMMVQLAKDPAYGLDPKKTADEYLRSRHFDPKNFRLTPKEEQEKPPAAPDPKIVAEQIKAEEKGKDREHEAQQKAADRQAAMDEKIIGVNHDTEIFNAEAQVKDKHGEGL